MMLSYPVHYTPGNILHRLVLAVKLAGTPPVSMGAVKPFIIF